MTTDDAILRFDGACKRYDGEWAVRPLTLKVSRGEFLGLLGRNGSGKSTSLGMASTLIPPGGGRVLVGGHDVISNPVRVRRLVGMVFQESALDRTLSIEENLRFAGALYGLSRSETDQRVGRLLELFDLTEAKGRRVAALSGGMRRAVDIIRGVLHRPALLLLDEPTTGLDPINRRAVWSYLARLRKEETMAMVLTTHYLEEAEGCDRVVFLRNGEIVGQGTPARLLELLGRHLLEIELDEERERELLERKLDLEEPLVDGDRLLYRLPDETPLEPLRSLLELHVRSWRIRRPDLNDVYLWLNREDLQRAGGGG
ncbi:MAG: ABC transporter ATP-binding protein [Gammaproteobacteria bacterium]|nr:MAG: ABC transporter ATP-binding protein [Gammaproteobacteria bacterium]